MFVLCLGLFFIGLGSFVCGYEWGKNKIWTPEAVLVCALGVISAIYKGG